MFYLGLKTNKNDDQSIENNIQPVANFSKMLLEQTLFLKIPQNNIMSFVKKKKKKTLLHHL